ncbi:4-hydroxy-3-methylbut-2-enyl diphosphate reductase [Streptomyces sp. NPDC006270]|uniref:4-hydroxy-3-methylbut-2-enyl diphosphate reductase n=1 Tax=Streptomyces sp. NPDC006270 TaxID=3364741 RepID=UPI0036B51FDF
MNRTKRSDVLPSSLPLAQNALSVATAWRHPHRGWMDCPAHPLLSAHARRAGFLVEALPWRAGDPTGGGKPPTTVFAVSYERAEGGHRGLALAARTEDTAAMAFAHHQIETWGAVLRTRRVLYVNEERPAPSVPAPGAPAVAGAMAAGAARLRPTVPSQAVTGWLACGCPAATECPSAGYAERSLRRSAERGDQVVVVGAPVTGPGAWPRRAPTGRTAAAANPRQAEELPVPDPDRLAFVVAPGAVVSEAAEILGVLRRRFPRLRGQHPGEWCYTMDDLRTAAGSVLAQSDALLVTGGGDGPLARTALAEAARTGVRVRDLTSLDLLSPEDVDGATITVLDTAAGDGPGGRSVAQILGGLGPASHVRRTVRSEAVPSPSGARSETPARV